MHSLERYSGAKSRMVRPKCWRVSARARPARRSSSALVLGAISAESERTVSLFSSGKLSSIGAKATIILYILAAASANNERVAQPSWLWDEWASCPPLAELGTEPRPSVQGAIQKTPRHAVTSE